MVECRGPNLDRVFQALSDQTRRAILRRVALREHTVGELAQPFRLTLAAVSKHVKVLERARLVRRRRQGSSYYLRLNPSTLQSADKWLDYYRRFWGERLNALQTLLEERP